MAQQGPLHELWRHERQVRALFRPETRAVYLESPGSLTMEVQDIAAIAACAHRHGARVLMDGLRTMAVRLHIGLEDPGDLIRDLTAGFTRLRAA